MAGRVARGDIWVYRFKEPDKDRPVLVLTRDAVIPALSTVVVATITTTIRGIRSEVPVGPEHGLDQRSVVNVDHLHTVDKARLRRRLGRVPEELMSAVCRSLNGALGCS